MKKTKYVKKIFILKSGKNSSLLQTIAIRDVLLQIDVHTLISCSEYKGTTKSFKRRRIDFVSCYHFQVLLG